MSAAAAIRAQLAELGGADLRPFDAHSHTGADLDGSSRSAAEHARDLVALGGRSVIFPFCVEGGYEAENRRVVAEAERCGDLLVPFARVDPRRTSLAALRAALVAGARGFKLHPRAEGFTLAHPGVEHVLAVADDARVPVLIHAGTGVGSFGATLTTLAARHRRCPIVLAHAGISDLAWLWRELPEHPNVYFDTAWLVPADLLALFALVPPGRILYGSDAPFMDAELLLAVALRCARFSGLDDDAVELVAGGQLENLLAGQPGIDAGPAPGAPVRALAPDQARVVSLLSAAGGCLLGGGDPGPAIELALLALAAGPGAAPESGLMVSLAEESRSASPQAIRALVLALTLAATPGVGEEALVG